MAVDCSQFQTKLNDITRRANVVVQQYEYIIGAAPNAPLAQLQEFQKTVSNLRSSIIPKIESDLLTINNEASDVGCRDVAKRASDTLGQIQFGLSQNMFLLENNLKKTISVVSQREADTEKATTSENNAGTGTPGTAGKGSTATPDSKQLEEVQVTSKKKPEQLEEVQVTGVKKDPSGLDEVKVTGKTNPDGLTEVQVTGKRNADGLEEVKVTGKKTTDVGAGPNNTASGVSKARSQAALKDTTNFEEKKDWRVRLCLSPGADYLYKAADPGILKPLKITDGVIFPYTPSISISYNANYDSTGLTHSNYKFNQYVNSSVDNISITCDFTAQDTFEANYLLAVIHFFRSITKMFYGQDQNPKPGTPPPLCYLFGLGQFQFNAHPLAITSFGYNLPAEVDYIRAGQIVAAPGANRNDPPIKAPKKPSTVLLDAVKGSLQASRLGQGIAKLGNVIGVDLIPGGGLGGTSPQGNMGFNSNIPPGTNEPTYVPTKIQIQISCIPIVSRYDVSNTFSLKDYATGKLLLGTKRKGGGIW